MKLHSQKKTLRTSRGEEKLLVSVGCVTTWGMIREQNLGLNDDCDCMKPGSASLRLCEAPFSGGDSTLLVVWCLKAARRKRK